MRAECDKINRKHSSGCSLQLTDSRSSFCCISIVWHRCVDLPMHFVCGRFPFQHSILFIQQFKTDRLKRWAVRLLFFSRVSVTVHLDDFRGRPPQKGETGSAGIKPFLTKTLFPHSDLFVGNLLNYHQHCGDGINGDVIVVYVRCNDSPEEVTDFYCVELRRRRDGTNRFVMRFSGLEMSCSEMIHSCGDQEGIAESQLDDLSETKLSIRCCRETPK